MLICKRILGLAVSMTLFAGAASALPSITIDVLDIGGGPQDVTASGTFTGVAPTYTWQLNAQTPIAEGGGTINSWASSLREGYPSPGPSLSNNINLTNTDVVAHTYLATVLLPIPAVAYDKTINNSVGATFTDSNGNNSLLLQEDGGVPMYQALINGTVVLNMPLGPFTEASCSPTGAGCSGTGNNANAFLLLTPGGATSLAIQLRFSLSPGDSVGFTDRFQIAPEPYTGAMVSLGLIGLGIAGRRRRLA